MKPVDKGSHVGGLKAYGDAKPELIDRLGSFCSYCECPATPQQLHVEHIYPQAPKAHPNLSTNWRNFLLACATCNTYKGNHLGNVRQIRLLKSHLWPHIDNTFVAFSYNRNGHVSISRNLSVTNKRLAKATRNLLGLLKTPAVTANYSAWGIAYDGITKRKEAWGIATRARDAYEENTSPKQLRSLCDNCLKTGFFSVWMKVFYRHSAVRKELIRECKAAVACFDATTTQPILRGRV